MNLKGHEATGNVNSRLFSMWIQTYGKCRFFALWLKKISSFSTTSGFHIYSQIHLSQRLCLWFSDLGYWGSMRMWNALRYVPTNYHILQFCLSSLKMIAHKGRNYRGKKPIRWYNSNPVIIRYAYKWESKYVCWNNET